MSTGKGIAIAAGIIVGVPLLLYAGLFIYAWAKAPKAPGGATGTPNALGTDALNALAQPAGDAQGAIQ